MINLHTHGFIAQTGLYRIVTSHRYLKQRARFNACLFTVWAPARCGHDKKKKTKNLLCSCTAHKTKTFGWLLSSLIIPFKYWYKQSHTIGVTLRLCRFFVVRQACDREKKGIWLMSPVQQCRGLLFVWLSGSSYGSKSFFFFFYPCSVAWQPKKICKWEDTVYRWPQRATRGKECFKFNHLKLSRVTALMDSKASFVQPSSFCMKWANMECGTLLFSGIKPATEFATELDWWRDNGTHAGLGCCCAAIVWFHVNQQSRFSF